MTRTCQSHLRHLLQVSCRSQWIVVHGHQIIGEHEVFQAPCDLSVFHFFRHKKTTNISGTYPYTTFHLSLFGNGWHIWSYDIYNISSYIPFGKCWNRTNIWDFGVFHRNFLDSPRNCVGGQGVKHLLDALESNYTLLTLDRPKWLYI